MKRFISRMVAVLLVFALIVPGLDVSAAETATTMRLVGAEGKVTVANKNGKQIKISNDMKLYNAYGVTTSAKSYAYIGLDNNKAVKMDAGTQVEIRKSGKKLEIHVLKGKIFCNVKAPLKKNESFNITTSTTVTGVRGTSFCMSVSDDTIEIQLYSGEVVTLVSGSGESLGLAAGQKMMLEGGAAATEKLITGDVPGFVAMVIADDPDMAQIFQKIDIDSLQLQSEAANRLKQDEDSRGNKDVHFPSESNAGTGRPSTSGSSSNNNTQTPEPTEPDPGPTNPTDPTDQEPGTEANPFEINSAEELLAIGADEGDYDGWTLEAYYVQTEDIDLTGKEWIPIGSEENPFTGSYDGGGKTISNLHIPNNILSRTGLADKDSVGYIGLFGYVGSEGMVENVIIKDSIINITGHTNFIGGVVGYNDGGNVINCDVTASVMANGTDSYTGSVVGYNNGGSITSCSTAGMVAAAGSNSYAGGIVGYTSGGNIASNKTTGNVGTNGVGSYAGGAVGYNVGGKITSCSAIGAVIASNTASGSSYAGGVTGYTSGGSITYCYAVGDVTANETGDSYAGGVAGYSNGSVTNCYATGDVTANKTTTSYAGGVVGYSHGDVKNCYAIGNVTANDPIIITYVAGGSKNYAGGVVGYCHGNVEYSYATGEISVNGGESYAGGIVGYSHGNVQHSVALNQAVIGTVSSKVGRIAGDNKGHVINCYAQSDMDAPAEEKDSEDSGATSDFTTITSVNWQDVVWWKTGIVAGSDESGPGFSADDWELDEDAILPPMLKNMPVAPTPQVTLQ